MFNNMVIYASKKAISRKGFEKLMKKFIAMLTVAATLAVSAFQIPVSAAFSDVSDTHPYKKAITTLSSLSFF